MAGLRELNGLLRAHWRSFPQMRGQDFFKLVYQHEWGGGHLIGDEPASLHDLLLETAALAAHTSCETVPPNDPLTDEPLFAAVGNGLCRLNLRPAAAGGVSWKTVNKLAVLSAAAATGSPRSFQKKLDLLHKFIQEEVNPDRLAELDSLICSYDLARHPPVSHSEAYRAAYRPAYRLVRGELAAFFPVFARLDQLMPARQSVRVAIDGMSGSGKSTLADWLWQIYGCAVIPMDHFFLPAELRTPDRLAQAGGNVDSGRFAREVLPGLRNGQPFTYQVFDCSRMAFSGTRTVTPEHLVVVEGSYSLHPHLAAAYDLKVFLEISSREQARRIRKREGIARWPDFAERWIPMENHYFSSLGIADQADLVLKLPFSCS
jgi:uridine kinase